jgi:hypothetical protein
MKHRVPSRGVGSQPKMATLLAIIFTILMKERINIMMDRNPLFTLVDSGEYELYALRYSPFGGKLDNSNSSIHIV